MRFFLDQNVDARVRKFFADLGHKCWTAEEAGLSTEADGNLTVYAANKGAIVVTHDREFSQSRRKHVIGQHIFLNCLELDATAVLRAKLDDFVPLFQRHSELYVVVSKEGMQVTYPNQTW